MSLYRTWRPKSFADLVGQDAVVRTLRTALSSGKLAHAYLFSGPRGSGKTSAAKILARCIECVLGPTPDPDNTCENCLAILAGTALDVIELDAASSGGVDKIRDLRESVKFAPSSMKMKVYIIDEAHMLTRDGSNALLKTLEEPPPHVVFVLATTEPEKLLPTVLSRCQRYAFRRIPVGVMIERMREIAFAEGIAIDDGALGAIAYRADGGLRDALTMLEQVASYAGGAVDTATVEAAFGATGRQYSQSLVAAILSGNGSGALRIVDEASDAGADMTGLVRGAIGEYRHLLVARIDPDLLGSDLSRGDAEAIVALAATTPQPRVVRGLRLLADALAAGRNSGNPRLELETAVLRLIVQAEDPSVDALAARVALLEAGAIAAPLPAARPAAQQRNAEPPGVARVPEYKPGSTTNNEFKSEPKRTPETGPEPVPTPEPARPAESARAARSIDVTIEPPIASAKPPASVAASPPPSAASPAPIAASPASIAAPIAFVEPSSPVAESPSAPPSLQQVRSQWDQIRLRAGEKSKPLMALLSQATVDAVAGNALTVGIGDPVQEGILRERVALLEAAVFDVLRVPLRVVVRTRVAGAPAAPRTSAQRATPAASANEGGGEIDLLAYARKRIGGTESS